MNNGTESPAPPSGLLTYCNDDNDCFNRTICVGKAFWHSDTLNEASLSVCECASGLYGWEFDDRTGACNKLGLGFTLQVLIVIFLLLWNSVILVVISENIYVLMRYTSLKLYGDTGMTALLALMSMATSLGALVLDFDDSSAPFRYDFIEIDGKSVKAGIHYYKIEILESISIALLYLAMFNIQRSWIEHSQKLNKTLVAENYPRVRKYRNILIGAQIAFIISVMYFIASVHTYWIGFVVVPFSILLIFLFRIGGNLLATILKNYALTQANEKVRQAETNEVAARVLKIASNFTISLSVIVIGYIATGIYFLTVQIPRIDAAPPGGFNRPMTWIGLVIYLNYLNCLSTIVRYLHPSIRASQEKYLATHKSTLSNLGQPKNQKEEKS